MKLTNEQILILKDCKIEENKIYVQGQLDRKQYVDINKILETIGAKWNRGKKAHIVEGLNKEDIENAFFDIFETGEIETLQETIKKFQFYPTPKEVAEYLVELADLGRDDKVLEPSAGQGAIVNQIDKDSEELVLIELNLDNCKILAEQGYNPINIDFLQYKNNGYYTKIIANPPFSKSQDVKHILHMYELLAEGGRIVSIASNSIQTREGKIYDELKELKPEFIKLPEGSFKKSGTMVNSVIVIINK